MMLLSSPGRIFGFVFWLTRVTAHIFQFTD